MTHRELPTFGMVPVHRVIRNPDLRPGPRKLLLWLLGAHGKRTPPEADFGPGNGDFEERLASNGFAWTVREATEALGAAERSIREWQRALKNDGILRGDPAFSTIWLPEALPGDSAMVCKVPFDWLPVLKPELWETWALLWSYRDPQGLAYPSEETIAEGLGLRRDAIPRRVTALKGKGAIHIVHRGKAGGHGRTSNEYSFPERVETDESMAENPTQTGGISNFGSAEYPTRVLGPEKQALEVAHPGGWASVNAGSLEGRTLSRTRPLKEVTRKEDCASVARPEKLAGTARPDDDMAEN